jgi:hypothetical protein
MQQRRLRPGDVLDDYCPRERRITDHAIVAMIDDEIQQTRCVVCDAEHDYKQAKVPPQRKKKAPALFTQVLDGLKAPARPQLPDVTDLEPDPSEQDNDEIVIAAPEVAPVAAIPEAASNGNGDMPAPMAPPDPPVDPDEDRQPEQLDGPFRRRLIRAALPRPEGTPPPARAIPEFTIHQPMGRNKRHGGGGRRRGQPPGQNGQTRFGRSAHGHRGNGHGRQGGGHGYGHGHGQGGHGQGGPTGNRGGRRGGKKR